MAVNVSDGRLRAGMAVDERASSTLRNVQAWIKDQKIAVTDGRISEYQVVLEVTFILEG